MAQGLHAASGDSTGTRPPRDARPAIDPESARRQCERILSDPLFSHSKRYSDLLKYIVDHTLEGKFDCLKERIIGIEVFGRSPDYDTSHDATVRVAITEVRKRLARYFEDPANQNELRVELPAGSYIAEFAKPHGPQKPHESAPGRRFYRRLYFVLPILAIVLLLGFWSARRLAPSPPIDQFWQPILNSQGTVLISMGKPVETTVPTEAPVSTPSEESLGQFIAQQSDFPVAELRAANTINTFLAQRGRQSVVRMAQTMTLSDMRSTPAVLLGSTVNQWAMRLGSGMRFQHGQTADGGLNWIEDTGDQGRRRWATEVTSPFKQVRNEYALITRALDSSTGQWWIGIGGNTVLGTLGAQQMITDPSAMSAMISQLPKDWQHKNLQAVIEFKMVDGSLGASRVVAAYSW